MLSRTEGALAAFTENWIKIQETRAIWGGGGGVILLKNPVNGETVMGKIKTLWQK
jgi:hypothetical protein